MNSEEIKREDFSGDMSQRAVSIYGQNDGMDDFPVLKAFQQYIDAEQEKSRKRIVGLGICFTAVLVVVIAVFMVLIYGINSRNQALSDRLVEFAMNQARERSNVTAPVPTPASAPVVTEKPSQSDAALKAMTETLLSLQKKLDEKPAAAPAPVVERVQSEDDEKLAKSKALLAIEKQRLAIEKERQHQLEIEQQRRRLYPELYEDTATRKRQESPSRTRTLTDDDIREIIREAYPEQELKSETKLEPAQQAKQPTSAKTSEQAKEAEDGRTDDAIEYFKDDDYTIPVDVKGSPSKVKFTVPVE